MEPPLTIATAAAMLAAGQLRPSQLLAFCLGQIDRHERDVQAWVVVDRQQAIASARAADEEIAAGHRLSPLHGIPIGIKDIVDVAGLPTRGGSTITSPLPAAVDAPIVAAMRSAGAILVGKTVTTELACFDPAPTRNPWNLRHTPGGSSSGSAAAVAAGMCLAAVGSQTGGSITRPATYCGVSGWKPTFGLISRDGVLPVSEHLDHVGLIARDADDLQLMAQALGLAELDDALPRRIAVVEPYFLEEASQEVREAFLAAIDRLASCGIRAERIGLPAGFADCHAQHRTIMAAEAAAVHAAAFARQRSQFGPNLASLLDEGLATRPQAYREALDFQRQFHESVKDWCEPYEAVVTPATNTTAPATLTTTGDPRFNSPWSLAGVPTVSTICGRGRSGMPVGWQWIGRPGEDARLLGIAAHCTARLGFQPGMPTL